MVEVKPRCSRPWEDMSIIGIAGGSGSGKSSVATEVIRSLNVPGAIILVMVDNTLPWPITLLHEIS